MTALRVSPDITSIVVSWEPPVEGEGRGLVTQYQVCYQPIGAFFSNCDFERDLVQRFRLTNLQPETSYVVRVRAHIERREGPVEQEMVTTKPIGKD